MRESPCLNHEQEYDVIFQTAEELNLDDRANLWVSEEDLAFGKVLYSIIKCQFPEDYIVVEAAKLLQLFRANRDTGMIPLVFFAAALLA